MKEYNFKEIEQYWQKKWANEGIYSVAEDGSRPKYYVLDMFPYPSGAGLHVGHPLGYIASDIYARYKRLKGYNVLHPMGYDSFGLPAEQYAIQTGQHPEKTTRENIARYREQLDKIGFSYDWSREVRTSNPDFYKWTQWIFLQLFDSWYNPESDKAEPISTLIEIFETKGYKGNGDDVLTGGNEFELSAFSAQQWKRFSEKEQQMVLLNFRLAYLSEAYVNWCPALGTVLSNDEVKDGVSERGGHPVERKLMKQWSLRITAYAERLLRDLDTIDWSESIKDAQRNWIGKSQGCSLNFKIADTQFSIEVFTTRPDTIFGVSFLTLAPEHELIKEIAAPEYLDEVISYVEYASNRSERERQADVKKITGQFTGAYAKHPFTGKEIPIYIGEYVLAGYGTGAVMGVPAHDSRDFGFATHFGLPKPQVIKPIVEWNFEEQSYDEKEGTAINSEFLNGLPVKEAIKKAIEKIEERGIGKGKTNYRLRDAIFGRQRYWGEPIPMYYKDGIPYPLPEENLPLVLPEVDKFLPTEDGEPPLARAKDWNYNGYPMETTTMPGWAGSSWYFLRYMDPHNTTRFADQKAIDYWQQVDLYIGGSEHATGHLLYVRFWTKFLFDLGLIPANEPAKKLINQGMIQGNSSFVYRILLSGAFYGSEDDSNRLQFYISKKWYDKFISKTITIVEKEFIEAELNRVVKSKFPNTSLSIYLPEITVEFPEYQINKLHADISFVNKHDELNIDRFVEEWDKDAIFLLEDEKYICGSEVEKMSKSKYNVINPDDIIETYGADTLRLYEMFLGPLEQSKPWSTQGIEGVHRFLKKLWRLFFDAEGNSPLSDDEATKDELKALHKLIKKVGEDIENFSFNTSVSAFMICVNELGDLKCSKKSILADLLVCLSPYAPHIAEELWKALGNEESIVRATFPEFNASYLVESSFSYPVSVNGKHRTNIEMPLDMETAEVEKTVLADETVQRWLEGKTPKKVVFVKGRIVNVVI